LVELTIADPGGDTQANVGLEKEYEAKVSKKLLLGSEGIEVVVVVEW
jgi:hypothetical protein